MQVDKRENIIPATDFEEFSLAWSNSEGDILLQAIEISLTIHQGK